MTQKILTEQRGIVQTRIDRHAAAGNFEAGGAHRLRARHAAFDTAGCRIEHRRITPRQSRLGGIGGPHGYQTRAGIDEKTHGHAIHRTVQIKMPVALHRNHHLTRLRRSVATCNRELRALIMLESQVSGADDAKPDSGGDEMTFHV